MAEKKKAASGKGLKKKLGPLPYWGWAAVGAGTFLVYRYLRARSAANAVNVASGTTGGTLIPNDIGLPSATNNPAGNFSSVASWTQAALAFMVSGGLKPADALNGITAWLNGNCISQSAYNAIAAAITSNQVGLPPGYSSVPTLSVCSSPASTPTTTTPTPPPAAPSAPAVPVFGGLNNTLKADLANNGESLVSYAWDPVYHDFVVLTNKGGVYNVDANGNPSSGGGFFGSYLGLPAADRQGTRTFTSIIVNPDGTYTATASDGSTYHFDAGIAALEGV